MRFMGVCMARKDKYRLRKQLSLIKNKKISLRKSIILLILMIFVIPNISSFDFDNVKSYDAVKQEITVTNAFGFGNEITKVRLDTPIHNHVGQGSDIKVAEFTITPKENLKDFFTNIEFYNLRNEGKMENRIYTFKARSYEEYEETYFIDDCFVQIKKNIPCTTKTATRKALREVWKELDTSKDITETMTIGIYTTVKKNDYMEFIPTFLGNQRVTEWATWEDTLIQGLLLYYDFDNSSVSDTNLVEKLNGVYNATTPNSKWMIGINRSAYFFDGTTFIVLSTNMRALVGNKSSSKFSYNLWANLSSTEGIILSDQLGDNAGLWLQFTGGSTYPQVDGCGGNGYVAIAGLNYAWTMWTIVIDQSIPVGMVFRDGVNVANITSGGGVLGNCDYFGSNSSILLGKRIQGGLTTGKIDEFAVWNKTLTVAEITSLYNGGTALRYQKAETPSSTIVTINSPIADYVTNNQSVTFNCTANSTSYFFNISLILDNIVNYTTYNTTPLQTSLTFQRYIGLSPGNHTFYCNASNSTKEVTTTSRNLAIDLTKPTIDILYPKENLIINIFKSTTKISNFNVSSSDNIGLNSCWSNNNGTNYTHACNENLTIIISENNFTWYYYANDTANNRHMNQTSFKAYIVYDDENKNKDEVGIGDDVMFSLYVNRTNIPSTSAFLTIFGTNYTPDTTTANTDYYVFTKNLNILPSLGLATGTNYSYNWTFNLSGEGLYKTNQSNLTIYNLSIDECGVNNFMVMNLTLRDEEDLNTLFQPDTLNGTQIDLDVNVTSKINSSVNYRYYHSYINNTNATITLCMQKNLLTATSYKIDFVLSYAGTDRVQEFYYLDNGTLDLSGYYNPYTKSNISLYDLKVASSTTFLFTFLDSSGNGIPNSIVHTYRKYIGDGLYREVERSKSDNNGETHMHLVEEDVIYYFMVTQNGTIIFTSSQYNAKCLSSPCSISFQLGTSGINWDDWVFNERNYNVFTDRATRIVYLNFTGNASRLVNFTLYRLQKGVLTYINTTSTTAQTGQLNMYVPNSYGNQTFYVWVYSNNYKIFERLVDLKNQAVRIFGNFGLLMGGFMILTLALMGVSEGVLILVTVPIGLIIITLMSLVDLSWMAIISLICVAVIIAFKLSKRRGGAG